MRHRVLAVSVALALALVTAGAFASQRHGDPSKGPPAGVGSVTKPGAPPAGGALARQQQIRINHVVVDLGASTPVPGAAGAPPASDSGKEHGRVPSSVPMAPHGASGASHAADVRSSHKSDDDDERDEGHGHHDGRKHGDDCDDDDDEGCGAPGDLSGTPTAVMPAKTATTPASGGGTPTATPTAPPPSPTAVAATPTATPTVRTCGSTPPPPEPCP